MKKQIRYWISYYCGGTFENQDIVADLIMKRIETEQLRIGIVSNRRELLLNFLDWYNEDEEKTPITEDEIDLFIKEKIK